MGGKLFNKYRGKDRAEAERKESESSYSPIPTLPMEQIRNEFFTKVGTPDLTGDGSKWDGTFNPAPAPTRKASLAAAAAMNNHFREGRVELEPSRNDMFRFPEWKAPAQRPSRSPSIPEIRLLPRITMSPRSESPMSPGAGTRSGKSSPWGGGQLQRRASEATWRDPFEQTRMQTPPGFVSQTAVNFSRKPSEATWRDPFENNAVQFSTQGYDGDLGAGGGNRQDSVSSVYSQYAPEPLKRKASVWHDSFQESRMPGLDEEQPYEPDHSNRKDSDALWEQEFSKRSDNEGTWTDPFQVHPVVSPMVSTTPPKRKQSRKASYAAWEEPDQVPLVPPPPFEDATVRWDENTLKGRFEEMSNYSKSSFSSSRKPRPYSYYQEPDLKHTKVKRTRASWYGNWSTRQIILIVTGTVIATATALGIGIGLWQNQLNGYDGLTPAWRPSIGSTMQFQIGSTVTKPSRRAIVYDVDLFSNNASTVQLLHSAGRRVICYFSAGAYDKQQPDSAQFPASVLGKPLSGSQGEQWLDVRQNSVRSVMTNRISMAKTMGCDGIDPDHVDGYMDVFTSNNIGVTGFGLTINDAADYVRFLANQAHNLGLAIGLKNSPDLINKTLDVLDWQLNEGCASKNECARFQPFIEAGKPVFHIEYASNGTADVLTKACNAPGTHLFSTMIKRSALDAWAADCPIGDPNYGSDGVSAL